MMDSKMKEFFDRLMSAAGNVAETAGDFAKETGKKLADKKDFVKCKGRIMHLEADKEELFSNIGRIIYEQRNGDEESTLHCEQVLAEIVGEIDQKQAEITMLEQELRRLSSERKCTSCGQASPKDYNFCPNCGDEFPAATEEWEENIVQEEAGEETEDTGESVTPAPSGDEPEA